MRIMHLTSEFPPQHVYGLGRYVHELSEAQAAAGLNVEVYTNSLSGDQHHANINGVEIHRVHFPPPPKAPLSSAMLLHFNLQLIERCIEGRLNGCIREYAIINAHDWLTIPAAFHLGRLLKVPVVFTIHDVIFNKIRSRAFTGEDAYVAGIENWGCHFAAKTIALSQSVRQEIQKHYHLDSGRIEVVPGGVSIAPIGVHEASTVMSFRSKFVQENEALLLYVGRLDPEKGLGTLLEAISLLAPKFPNFRTLIAGTGKLRDQLNKEIAQRGLGTRITLLGYLPKDQLRIAYAAADVVAVPSTYEPFGLVSLEAQRMGTPVVCTEIGGLAETLGQTKGGLSFPLGSATDLAFQIERVLTNDALRHELGQTGQYEVSKRFQWAEISRQISYIYNTVQSTPPMNIVAPEWHDPISIADKKLNPHSSSTAEPLSSILIVWHRMDPVLVSVIQALKDAHALVALRGSIKIHLLEKTASDAPLGRVPIGYVDLKTQVEYEDLLEDCAAVITTKELVENTVGFKINRKSTPTIILNENANGAEECNSVKSLFFLVNKIVCDERLRFSLANRIDHSIPQITWVKPQRPRPLILHVLPQLVTGGAETTLLEIVRGCRDDFDHAVICVGKLEGPLPKEFSGLGISVQTVNSSFSALVDTLTTCAPDILHLHSMSYIAPWIALHRRLATHIILETEHVVNIGCGHFGPVDHVVCVSKATLSAHTAYRRLMSTTGFKVIYNGINRDDYAKLPSRAEARESLGLPLDGIIFGRVSALERNKLPLNALRCAEVFLQRIPDSIFVIVGDGAERQQAERWINDRGLSKRVKFIGERRDIPQILPAFDVFAYYTERDALGNVLLESLAAGVPVVATCVEGTPEAVEGTGCELVPLGDFSSFATALSRALQNKRVVSLPHRFESSQMCASYRLLYYDYIRAPLSTLLSPPHADQKVTADTIEVTLIFLDVRQPRIENLSKLFENQPHSHLRLIVISNNMDFIDSESLEQHANLYSTRVISYNGNSQAERIFKAMHACSTEIAVVVKEGIRLVPKAVEILVGVFARNPAVETVICIPGDATTHLEEIDLSDAAIALRRSSVLAYFSRQLDIGDLSFHDFVCRFQANDNRIRIHAGLLEQEESK